MSGLRERGDPGLEPEGARQRIGNLSILQEQANGAEVHRCDSQDQPQELTDLGVACIAQTMPAAKSEGVACSTPDPIPMVEGAGDGLSLQVAIRTDT
jgi:Tfp pilus assembly protein PilV